MQSAAGDWREWIEALREFAPGMKKLVAALIDSATEQSKQTRVDETCPAVSRPRKSLAPVDLAVSDAEARSSGLAPGSGYQAVGG